MTKDKKLLFTFEQDQYKTKTFYLPKNILENIVVLVNALVWYNQ